MNDVDIMDIIINRLDSLEDRVNGLRASLNDLITELPETIEDQHERYHITHDENDVTINWQVYELIEKLYGSGKFDFETHCDLAEKVVDKYLAKQQAEKQQLLEKITKEIVTEYEGGDKNITRQSNVSGEQD